MNASETNREIYLECEKRHIFLLLMFVGGFYGAYTYSCRGGVFCNAQTANFVLFSMKLGQGEWLGALYYLIPMSAYLLGSMLSELLPGPIRRRYMVSDVNYPSMINPSAAGQYLHGGILHDRT